VFPLTVTCERRWGHVSCIEFPTTQIAIGSRKNRAKKKRVAFDTVDEPRMMIPPRGPWVRLLETISEETFSRAIIFPCALRDMVLCRNLRPSFQTLKTREVYQTILCKGPMTCTLCQRMLLNQLTFPWRCGG